MSLGLCDLRQTARALLHQPTNSLLIVIVLALGMAGVIAMLSIIKSMVWDPLPYPNADQVVSIGWRDRSRIDSDIEGINGKEFLEWRRRLLGQALTAGSGSGTINVSDKGVAERYDGAFVTHELFTLLGVSPILGRDFSAEDDRVGAPPTAIISHSTWQTRFAADPQIVGRQIRANAQPATIIGVMPAGFGFPGREEVWMAARIDPAATPSADRYLDVFVQPTSGTTFASIETSLEAWITQARQEDSSRWGQAELASQPMSMMFADPDTRLLLNLMLATCVLVLVVACANAANLMLARTLSRSRDLALRLTLGASRWRVTSLLLAQSLALTLLALAVAIPLAQIGINGVLSGFDGSTDGPPPWIDFSIDLKMTAFAAAVAVATALIVGMLPVIRLRTDKLGAALRDGGRSVAGGGIGKLSRALVVGELAVACVVLLATVVMVRGVERLGELDLGIDQANLLTARIALFPEAYPTDADTQLFAEKLTLRLRTHPDVLAATAASTLPGLMATDERMLPEGFEVGDNGPPRTRQGAVDANFAQTYGVQLRAGRFIEDRDTVASEPVLVIDQAFADQIFPNLDPLGRRVKLPADGESARWHTIIGVIETLQLEDAGDESMPTSLVALTQHPARFISVAVRTRGEPGEFKPEFSALLREIDPDTPAYWLRTFDEVVHSALAGERVLSSMFSVFGIIALILAAAGLYGLIAQLVGQRTREIGVQRALGASGAAVLKGLLGSTLWQIALGLVIGIGMAIPFADLVQSSSPSLADDAVGFGAIAILGVTLLVVALIATLVPARRALKVDPMVALRHE